MITLITIRTGHSQIGYIKQINTINIITILANENQGYLHVGRITILSSYLHPTQKNTKDEVNHMYATDHKTIKELFYKQFEQLTKKQQSFDMQFSDRWTPAL
jgi:hypothetical protein